MATLVSHLSFYLVLLLALRHVGVSNAEVSWVQVLAWFAFARLLTAVPVTPAGLGLVEATLIGGLTGAGGDREQLTAAVLVPGPDLVPADPGRGRLLAVVAAEPADIPAGHPSGWPTGGHPRDRRGDQHRPARYPGTRPPAPALTTWPPSGAVRA